MSKSRGQSDRRSVSQSKHQAHERSVPGSRRVVREAEQRLMDHYLQPFVSDLTRAAAADLNRFFDESLHKHHPGQEHLAYDDTEWP